MRKLDGMTVYVGKHKGVGYVITGDGVWWTHAGHGGAEESDEKAYRAALAAIDNHGTQQGKDIQGEAHGASGDCGAGSDGASGAQGKESGDAGVDGEKSK